MKRNVVAICGIETVRDEAGNVKKFSTTFLNNMITWKKNNPKDALVVIYARDYLKCEDPIAALWAAVCGAYPDGIDELIYSGHSSSEHLIIYSHVLYELSDDKRWIGFEFPFIAPFKEGAVIRLWGCQAGGQEGKKWPNCIAQTFADKSQRTVYAFISKSSQRKRNGGFYQVPDVGGMVRFDPKTP